MNKDIKPIGILKSLLYFGIPGILIYLSMYDLVPILLKHQVPEAIGVLGSMWLMTIPLIIIGIILYKKETIKFSWKEFFQSFHFHKLKRTEIKYIVIGIFVTVIAEGVLGPLGAYFAKYPILAPPAYLSAPFNPLDEFVYPIKMFMGISLRGNWVFLLIFILLHSLAMFGEELIWRGYLLPRQVKRYGKYAWILNGILWAYLMHSCLKWNFISMIPSMLVAPYMAQKTNNTTVSLIIHAIPNMLIWLIILIGVLGLF